jgi:hypothetical protein
MALQITINNVPVEVVRQDVMCFFSTEEAVVLRLVSRLFLEAARDREWADTRTVVTGDIARWRACFPRAIAANLGGPRWSCDAGLRGLPIPEHHFPCLSTLEWLSVRNQPSFTDTALLHLGGPLQFLDASGCTALTGLHMEHLAGAALVVMDGCRATAFSSAVQKGVKATSTGGGPCCAKPPCPKIAQSKITGMDGKHYCSAAHCPPHT